METKEKKEEEEKQPSYKTETTVNLHIADSTDERTKAFNKECNDFREKLGKAKEACQAVLGKKLAENPSYHDYRDEGVKLAREYERAEVLMGGKGTANWNNKQRKELIERGKVDGSEGHHINNVANNPELQADPDNIRFYLNRDEHIQKGHNGNVNNPSSGSLIDRDKRLANVNRKRVMLNEVNGVLTAFFIGGGKELASSIYHTCKEEGCNMKAFSKGIKQGGKPAIRGAFTSFAIYAIARGIDSIL